jgi:hypothetical protein
LPGESGPDATMEVDPHRIGPVRMSYSPQTDGAPDPGEVVWTWVPFEENDGRARTGRYSWWLSNRQAPTWLCS